MKFNLQKINKLVKLKKVTQKELGDNFGVSDKTILNYLHGRTKIDVDTIAKFSNFFDVPVGYFFDESELPINNNGNINNGVIQAKNGNISIKVAEQENEIEKLRVELEGCKELLSAKDELIAVLRDNLLKTDYINSLNNK